MGRGYQAKDVMELTGLTYRQMDHWVKSEIVNPFQTIQKGNRSERIFNFENLIVIRAAMKLLDFGLGFSVVKKAAARLQQMLAEGTTGQYLFWSSGENLSYLSNDPDEIMKLIRGKCVVTVDIGQIENQLRDDIKALAEKKSRSNGKGRSYVPPTVRIA